jgi:hypothetical protein
MADEIRILRPQGAGPNLGSVGVSVGGRGDAALIQRPRVAEEEAMRQRAMESERRRAAAASAALRGGGGRPSNDAIWEGAKKDKARRESEIETRLRDDLDPDVQAEIGAEPMAPVFNASGQAAIDAMDFARAADQRVVLQRRNPMHEPVKRHIGETAGAQTQILQGVEAERAAQVSAATQAAEFMANEARRQNDAIIDARAAEFERQQMLDEGIQALREVNKNVAEATATFSETKGVDPGRHWASRTAGQKFVAVLGGIARGLLKMDPMAHLQAAIDNDIAAQEANIGLRKTALDEAQEGVARASNVYETLRLNVGDKRTADMMMEQARLGQAEQQFKALLAEHGLNQLTAEQDRFLGEIGQRRADLALLIEQRTAANPRMITSVRKARGAAERKVLGQLAGESAKASRGLQSQGFEQQGRERVEMIKGEMEVAKKQAEGQGKNWEQQKWIAEKTEPHRNELKAIQDFKKKYPDDIPGVFFGSSLSGGALKSVTGEQRQARRDLLRIAMLRLRRESGAAISEEELHREAENLVDSWSEGDVRADLDSREREALRRIDLYERAPETSEVESYRGAAMQDREAMVEQGGVADPVMIDE